MTLKYLAGTLPRIGVYTLVMGTLNRLPSGKWDLNARTVASVELVGAGKEYNYAAGGVGIVAGGIVAGPVGALVGGLVPKAFKDDVVQFVIRFRNGDVAHFAGSPGDYKRALRASYSGTPPAAPAPAPTTPEPAQVTTKPEPSPESEEARNQRIEKFRAEMAAIREARAAQPKRPGYVLPPVADDGKTRVWFDDIDVPQYVDGSADETKQQRRERTAANDQRRREYKADLLEVKKRYTSTIHASNLPFMEGVRLLKELDAELRDRLKR